jgi:hypothetical protein
MIRMTAEHDALRDVVRHLLTRQAGGDAVRAAAASPRGYDQDLWSALCDQIGVAALAIPEEYGGAGATLLETHVVLEELGRTLAPTPLLGSAVLAAQAILSSDEPDACARLLPGIASGRTIAALAWSGYWDPAGTPCTFDGVLHGTEHYVLDGDLADVLIVAARTEDGFGLFEVDPAAVRRAHVPTMDTTRRLATVHFDRTPAIPLTRTAALSRLRDLACVAVSAEQVGAAQRCLDMTVEYCKTRVQFGRPIGGFQALKHRMADMYVLVETARSASYAAAHDHSLAAVAKVHCSETLSTVAGETIQLHGGMAITWEHDAHLYFKRAHSSAQLFGQPHEYVRQIQSA